MSLIHISKDSNPSSEDMSDTVYKLQKRVEQYSTEAQVYQEGSDRINVEIPGVTDADVYKRQALGMWAVTFNIHITTEVPG